MYTTHMNPRRGGESSQESSAVWNPPFNYTDSESIALPSISRLIPEFNKNVQNWFLPIFFSLSRFNILRQPRKTAIIKLHILLLIIKVLNIFASYFCAVPTIHLKVWSIEITKNLKMLHMNISFKWTL